MKTKIDNKKLKFFKESIDWWREETMKTSEEVEEIQVLFEAGAISEEDVIDHVRELNDRMDYLFRKGQFEQRNLFEIFVSNAR